MQGPLLYVHNCAEEHIRFGGLNILSYICSMIQLKGKNTDFVAYWHASVQYYDVFYKGKLLVTRKYRYRDIASYLN